MPEKFNNDQLDQLYEILDRYEEKNKDNQKDITDDLISSIDNTFNEYFLENNHMLRRDFDIKIELLYERLKYVACVVACTVVIGVAIVFYFLN